MRTQASKGLGGFFSWSSAWSAKARGERWKPTTRATPPAVPVFRKSRRFTTEGFGMGPLGMCCGQCDCQQLSGGLGLARLHGRGAMDGLADALVGAAAADVAAHGIVDIGVGGVGFLGEQRYCGHDLSGLAVAALRNVFFHPGLLHGMAAIGGGAFDGGEIG